MDQGHSDPKKPKPSESYLRYTGLGLQLLVTIGVGAWLGYKLDHFIGWKFPVFLLLFVFMTFGGSMYFIYRSLNGKQ